MIIIALIIGSMWYDLGVTVLEARSFFGVCFMSCLFLALGSFPQLQMVRATRPVYFKHRDNYFYPPGAVLFLLKAFLAYKTGATGNKPGALDNALPESFSGERTGHRFGDVGDCVRRPPARTTVTTCILTSTLGSRSPVCLPFPEAFSIYSVDLDLLDPCNGKTVRADSSHQGKPLCGC